jgi:D-glucuronyl C5-epimerase C-terminus
MRAMSLAALVAGACACAAAPAAAGANATGLAPARVRVHAHAAARRGPTVTAALRGLLQASAIDEAAYHEDYSAYVAAKATLAKLGGTRRSELGAVLANVQAMAGAGELTASRLPAVFLTLERNRQWWGGERLLSGSEYVSFPGSLIVWEHYPGEGVEIQWLATFGKANGYYLDHESANLRQLLDEVIPLATQRAGGIAWEYLFAFDGGSPPWTSGLSQGTAIQALTRAWTRLKEPAYLTAAQQALGVFEQPPPQGVRVDTPAGALYAEYTYAPSDRILNGFIQSLVGLYEYTALTKDPLGAKLFEAGDAEARAIVPLYNTGAWSLYDQFGESNLNYHELLAEFLQHLCERTRKGPPLAPAGVASAPIPGDDVYCTTAAAFEEDLHTPPAISLLSKTLPAGARAGVRMSLSKVATVQLTVRQGARVVWSNTATVEHGKPRLLWITPAKGGSFSVTLRATDLAGNVASASGTVLVSARHT